MNHFLAKYAQYTLEGDTTI